MTFYIHHQLGMLDTIGPEIECQRGEFQMGLLLFCWIFISLFWQMLWTCFFVNSI